MPDNLQLMTAGHHNTRSLVPGRGRGQQRAPLAEAAVREDGDRGPGEEGEVRPRPRHARVPGPWRVVHIPPLNTVSKTLLLFQCYDLKEV